MSKSKPTILVIHGSLPRSMSHPADIQCPTSDQDHWISLLKPHPAIAALTPLTNAGYKYMPSTYLFCENDQAIALAIQRSVVAAIDNDVFGGKMREATCSASHSPCLSMPAKVVEVIDGL